MTVMAAPTAMSAEGEPTTASSSRAARSTAGQRSRPSVRIDEPDLARGMTPTAAMPVPGGEAEALGLRPGVADHERGAHRGGGQARRPGRSRPRRQPDDDAEVDDRLAGRSKTESRNAPSWLTLPVARASVPSNMSKTPPTKTRIPADEPQLGRGAATAPTTVIAKPMRVSPFGRQAEAADARGRSARRPRDAGRGSRCEIEPLTSAASISGRDAEDGRASRRRRTRRTPPGAGGRPSRGPPGGVSTSPAARSRPRCHETSGCDSPTCRDELGDGRLAVGQARTMRSRFTSARALWNGAQLAQVVGLDDGGGDRAADAGGGWGQGRSLRGGRTRRINGGLYQSVVDPTRRATRDVKTRRSLGGPARIGSTPCTLAG